MAISVIFTISLLAGAAANAAYSSDNADYYDDNTRCGSNNLHSDEEDACNDLARARDAQGAAAVSFSVMQLFIM